MKDRILYTVQPIPEKRLFDVKCIIGNPNLKGQKITLPAWIPGSYLIRDFTRHIVSLQAYDQEKTIPIEMLDKNSWVCRPKGGPLTIHMQVNAYDLAPRGAHIDTTHAFFNGSRLFVQVIGQEKVPHIVDIIAPHKTSEYQHWRVATSMPSIDIKASGFGQYLASGYEDLIDHPVEIGQFEVVNFKAAGIDHQLVVSGKHKGDLTRVSTDLAQICEYHINFFSKPIPINRYVFLLTVLNDGYGGLEHRFSSVVHCKRDYLPKTGDTKISEGYRTLLGLFSHEYFHTWNVKRIKPEVFAPYDLTQENYTRQLWIFEGITSYYDELALIRTNRISRESYFELVGQLITRVYSTPGRFKQTLEQASFEAWTKFYKPDENSPNATISYYTKGALVALALDLLIRHKTDNQCSLDEIMRTLWQKYGVKEQGLPEGSFENIAAEVSGCDLSEFFDIALRSTQDLPLDSLLKNAGITLQSFPALSVDDLGGKKPNDLVERPLLELKLKSNTSEVNIASIFDGGAAEAAGLAPGDVIIAVNGLKVDRARFETTIGSYAVGEEVQLHVFRREELLVFNVKLQSGWMRTYQLTLSPDITEQQQAFLNAWLNGG